MSQVSPLAGSSPVVSSAPASGDTIITITPIAHAKLIELRDAESALKSLEKKKIKDEVIEKSTVAEMKKLDGEIAAARKKLAELKK